MKKRILAGALCLILVLGGCSTGDSEHKKSWNPVKESSEQSKLNALHPHAYGNVQGLVLESGATISLIGRGEKTAYWRAVEDGAQAAVDEMNKNLGYKGNDKITLNYAGTETENDVDGQVNILDEELALYPVAVGIALADATASQVQFDMAADNGIPVVAFDSGTDYKDVDCMVDTDNMEAAKTAAAKLCDAIGDSGEILVFVHDSNSTSAEEREAGFVNEITSKHGNVAIANIYHMDELEMMKREIGKETETDVIRYIIEKYPEARGIYVTSESVTKAVLNVLDEMKNQDEYKIVGFDGGEDQLERLEEGKLTGLIVQNPYGMGYATVVACVRAAMGEGNEAVVDAGFTWVTVKNMNDEAIQNMMY